jgi:hypothetical protein
MKKLSKVEVLEMSIEEPAEMLGTIAEELNDRGAIGGTLDGRNGINDYLVGVHMKDERVPASKGHVRYERFDCGDTHDVERKVIIGKVAFYNIMGKKEAKKLMQEELLA